MVTGTGTAECEAEVRTGTAAADAGRYGGRLMTGVRSGEGAAVALG